MNYSHSSDSFDTWYTQAYEPIIDHIYYEEFEYVDWYDEEVNWHLWEIDWMNANEIKEIHGF